MIGAAALGAASYAIGRHVALERAESDPLEEIAEYHAIYAEDANHLVEVPAERGEELIDWFSQRLGRRIVPPDLTEFGFELAGGRLLAIDAAPVAELFYTRPGEKPLGICIAPFALGPDRPLVAQHDGLTLAAWRRDGTGYAVIGALPPEPTRAIANHLVTRLA
jgi:anti-sigma factor RsiW